MDISISELQNTGEPKIEFIEAILSEFDKDPAREFMDISDRYYTNENDINDKIKTFIDRDGTTQELKLASNSKLSHPFLRKLAKQKVNYFLSKPFSIVSEDAKFADLLNKKLGTDAMRKLIKNTAVEAVTKVFGWLQVYYDVGGVLQFKNIPSNQVKPFWSDFEHTKLNALLRKYKIKEYDLVGETVEYEKIEWHTKEGVWNFTRVDGVVTAEGLTGTFEIVGEDGTRQQVIWKRIPFIAFKYNAEEVPLLKLIKPLIDDYDGITSETSNNINDIPQSILNVKNYDGGDKEDFRHNLNKFRAIFTRGDGGVETLTLPLDIDMINGHLDRVKKDIYDFGNGVDTENINTGNKSGVALKFLFGDLDQDTEDFASEIKDSFQQMGYFIVQDALLNNEGDYTEKTFDVEFNKDLAINETEAMEVVTKAVSVPGISRKTILAQVPFISDVDAEIKQYEKEQQDAAYNDDLATYARNVNSADGAETDDIEE